MQRAFGRSWVLTVDYLGSEDHHLFGYSNINLASLPGSNFIDPYVFKVSGIYELPFGKNKLFLNRGKWWQNELGGWRISGFLTVEGGPPFNVSATDSSNTGGGRHANLSRNGKSNGPDALMWPAH